jgi:hypothetical protein
MDVEIRKYKGRKEGRRTKKERRHCQGQLSLALEEQLPVAAERLAGSGPGMSS